MLKPTLTPRQGVTAIARLAQPQHSLPIQTRRYSAPGDGSIPISKQKYIPTSGTYPKGFLAGSAHVGVKASNTRFDDLALIASITPCSAAAVFTTNRFQAAPVTVSREVLKERSGEGVWGVVINSGCANAVTGKGGIEDARIMGEEADKCLRESRGDLESGGDGKGLASLVMSTGVIGQRLPIQKITNKIPSLARNLGTSHDHWLRTARAICTTDTFPKLISHSFTLPSWPGTTFNIAGMTKGAGMIHPNMATLLGVIATDASVAPSALQSALKEAVAKSFNSISVDGDTSTNDTVAVLANGAALTTSTSSSPPSTPSTTTTNESQTITSPTHPSYPALLTALTTLTTSLSNLIIRDGEGATKFVTIRVTGSPSASSAHAIASTIARSPLVKTALYGRDANWGRILCAVGYTPGLPEGTVVPEKTSVSFVPARVKKNGEGLVDASEAKAGELKLLVNGEPQVVDEARAAELLKEEDVEILVRLRPEGEEEGEEVVFWTCDFSHEYVTINGDYRT